jgi:hypothetical protein
VGDKQQQLSPVSVLDFAFDDNDGEEEGSDAGTSCSCSSPAFQFQRCTPPAVDLHGKLASEQLRSLPSTPSVSFYLSLDSVKLHYPATNKNKRREYIPLLHIIRRSPASSSSSFFYYQQIYLTHSQS